MNEPVVVRAGGMRLRVARQGAGRAPADHGIGANLDTWWPFARRVSDRELIAFDAPGTGLSQRPRGPLRMSALAEIVREPMDELALERADVLGYSFGSGLTQELARRAPDRVRRLVLCATGPASGAFHRARWPPSCSPAPTTGGCWSSASPHIAGGRTARDPTALAEHAGERLARPPDVVGYAYQLYAAAGWTSLPWLHRITAPTLIVAGGDDPSVPVANARMLAARLPNAPVHVLEGGGHLFLLDEPQNAIAPILSFLDADL